VVLMDRGEVLSMGTAGEIFADTALLHRARLKPPVVMDLFRELSGRGVLDGEAPPGNPLAFTDLVERRVRGHVSADGHGRIYIADVGDGAAARVRGSLSSGMIQRVGAMGTKAKRFAATEGIDLDFTYGVIDKCLLRAVNGETSLILTSGGMIEHTGERIAAYMIESGREIEVHRV